jgi:hypothetical protein
MSGRAGHRGKDERGICIIMIDERVILWLFIFSVFFSVYFLPLFFFPGCKSVNVTSDFHQPSR